MFIQNIFIYSRTDIHFIEKKGKKAREHGKLGRRKKKKEKLFNEILRNTFLKHKDESHGN